MNNTNNNRDNIEFGDAIKIIFPKMLSCDGISYKSLEVTIPANSGRCEVRDGIYPLELTIPVNDRDIIEFGDTAKIIIPKNSSDDEIYKSIELTIPVLVVTFFSDIVEELDDKTKNIFIGGWFTSSKDEKIKKFMMGFLTTMLKVYKFKTNSIKCNIVFNSFCNEAVDHFKKNFSRYEIAINHELAA